MTTHKEKLLKEARDAVTAAQSTLDEATYFLSCIHALPSTCQCDPREWRDSHAVPRVCANFEPAADDKGRCANCEHDRACHGDQVKE